MPVGSRAGWGVSLIAQLVCTTERTKGTQASACTRPETALGLEAQRFDLDHVGQSTHRVEDRRGQRLVDLDECDRLAAGSSPAEMEGRDVHRRRTERIAERADEPGLV